MPASRRTPRANRPDPEPLLDIETIAPARETVRIRTKQHPEGRLYEIRYLSDFGLSEQRMLQRDGLEYDELWRQEEELTEDEEARVKLLLDRLFNLVLDAPSAVKAAVSDPDRARIVRAFTIAPQVAAARKTQKEQRAAESGSTTAT